MSKHPNHLLGESKLTILLVIIIIIIIIMIKITEVAASDSNSG